MNCRRLIQACPLGEASLGYGAGVESGLELADIGADPEQQHRPEEQTADRRPQSLKLELGLELGPSLEAVASTQVLSEFRCWLGSPSGGGCAAGAWRRANALEYRPNWGKAVSRGEIEWMQPDGVQQQQCRRGHAALRPTLRSIGCPVRPRESAREKHPGKVSLRVLYVSSLSSAWHGCQSAVSLLHHRSLLPAAQPLAAPRGNEKIRNTPRHLLQTARQRLVPALSASRAPGRREGGRPAAVRQEKRF